VALKSEFDSKTYVIVLVRALTGAVIGAVPGLIYFVMAGQTPAVSTFAVGLMQLGASVGAIALGLAAAAATIVSSIKNRGSGPQHGKAKRLQEYMTPEPLPVIPPPSKPDVPAEKTEVRQPVLNSPPPALERTATPPPLMVASEQPGFQDYDR
jgi:hypothetical protein